MSQKSGHLKALVFIDTWLPCLIFVLALSVCACACVSKITHDHRAGSHYPWQGKLIRPDGSDVPVPSWTNTPTAREVRP